MTLLIRSLLNKDHLLWCFCLTGKGYSLRRQLKKSYEERIRPRSYSIWRPFKPPRPNNTTDRNQPKSCDLQDEPCDPQGGSCDFQDKTRDVHADKNLKMQILTKSLFPYVKKLSLKEISSIKDGLQQKQDPSVQQVGVADQARVTNRPLDGCDCHTKAADCEMQKEAVIKKRPSLSLKRRRHQDITTDVRKRRSPFKIKFSPVKKSNLVMLTNEELMLSSQLYSADMGSTESSKVDESLTSRYNPLQFVPSVQEHPTSRNPPCRQDDDNFDALLNMGYLSPVRNTHADHEFNPDDSSLLLSPLHCISPVPSTANSPLNKSFSLVLPGSSSSSPQQSSSSCTDTSSPSPPSLSPTSCGHKLIEDVVIDGQVHYDEVMSSGSHDHIKESTNQIVDPPLDGSDSYDAISCISESPKSKLCDDGTIDADDSTCVITPALAPPTSSHLLNTLDKYGLPHVVYEQPFCSDPHDVPPVK